MGISEHEQRALDQASGRVLDAREDRRTWKDDLIVDLCIALRSVLREHPVFRNKPVGAPHSVARTQQDIAMEAEDSGSAGKSGYRGVYPTASGKFMVLLCVKYKIRCLGTFNTAESAAQAWDQEAYAARGSFTYLNFPDLVAVKAP